MPEIPEGFAERPEKGANYGKHQKLREKLVQTLSNGLACEVVGIDRKKFSNTFYTWAKYNGWRLRTLRTDGRDLAWLEPLPPVDSDPT